MAGKSWYKVPTKLLKMEIPTSAKLVLVVLYDAERDAAGEVELTLEQIERRSGYSRRQCIRAIEALVLARLLIVQRTGRASRYIFPPDDRLLPPKGRRSDTQPEQLQQPEQRRQAARSYLQERGYHYDDI